MNKIITTFFIIFFLNISPSFAWIGYEKDSTNMMEIGSGNLVREGLVIEFFDFNENKMHEAEVTQMQDDGNMIELTLFDVDLQKKRIFLME
ncbi:DUF5334 family protein [Rickettsiales bacterium]|nr:DUF5334 family protein [Rickettsiales bacterium]